jgi:mRNA interferase YafQ
MMKRGADTKKLGAIVDMLAADQPLPARMRPHRLSGRFNHFWECHIEPDWLLIYDLTPEAVELVATGTHSDLFR